ncbi:MAG: helix-turn-helix domain-containing protein [Erysipelotrichia bacterium]|nr:helix-turn-helix domain-containing protein [Erysipelotrichia bacterium]NCC55362.1 helix-turn-helix domain-containing protein [Erysipelotrichia bacterium]
MKDVGIKLQEKRKLLKLSYEEVAKLTRLPISTIKAIEAGDLDHFQDDLTYVRFYVRQYCKAIDVPYESFKDDVLDSVEEYTQTMSLNMLKEHEKMEDNIAHKASVIKKANNMETEKGPQLAKKDRSSIAYNTKQSSRFRKVKKVDFAFLSLMIVIVIVIAIVLYVAFTALFDKKEVAPANDDKISDVDKTPTPEKEETESEEESKPKEESDSKVVFEQIAANHYRVSGIKAGENMKMEITFTNSGSFNLWKGNTSFANAYGMYEANSTYTYESSVVANELLTLNFWNYGGAEIKINGKKLEYDASKLAPQDGVTYFQITTKGE